MEEQDFDTLLDLFISAERGWSSLDWISTLPEDILINIMCVLTIKHTNVSVQGSILLTLLVV